MPKLSDFLCGGERRVPRGPLPSMNPLDIWTQPSASGLRATWLGHSTVLIETGLAIGHGSADAGDETVGFDAENRARLGVDLVNLAPPTDQ